MVFAVCPPCAFSPALTSAQRCCSSKSRRVRRQTRSCPRASSDATAELDARQQSAREWITPWLSAQQSKASAADSSTESEKEGAAQFVPASSNGSNGATPAGEQAGKFEPTHRYADGSVMYVFDQPPSAQDYEEVLAP